MIIDFDRTIAYKCPYCGEITYGDFSLFELSGKKGISVYCTCGDSKFTITHKERTSFLVQTSCVICDKNHDFLISMHDLYKRSCTQLSCPDVGIGLAFIGKADDVKIASRNNERAILDVVSACGLEHTGKNGILMLKALDKIQDLSENDSLICGCGSKVIDVEVREDEIVLECCLCGEKAQISISEIKKGDLSKLNKIIIGQKKRPM